MRVIVLGPNGINDATFHVHRAGCRDIYKPAYRWAMMERSNWALEATSEQVIVEDLFSDFLPENDNGEPTTWQDYANEVRIFPCVKYPAGEAFVEPMKRSPQGWTEVAE